MIYLTHDHIIDAQALTVTDVRGQRRKIRPKTCQLLLLLLQNTETPLSKQTILETVWAETVVAEQVVFQSIKEIRQLFGESEVIKTLPKQGYLWLPPVSVRSDKAANSDQPKPRSHSLLFFSLVLLLVIGASVSLFLEDRAFSNEKVTEGSVVVLPTQNKVPGNDHSWVRLGLMDQLIQRLPNSEQQGVLQTDYVIEVLKRAGIDSLDVEEKDIPAIFNVSGAEFVVASKLSGSPFDYQLSYEFFHKGGSQKGVLFDKDIQTLTDEFSQLIARRIGDDKLEYSSYHADFNTALLGQAIEKRLAGQLVEAKLLLESVILSDAQNLTAQRILIATLFALKSPEEVVQRLQVAIPLAREVKDLEELTRLLYFQAIHHYQSGDAELAMNALEEAQSLAAENQDWLYQAYTSEMMADMARIAGDYVEAESLYHQAKQFHKVLKCPLGESTAWASLAELAKLQGDEDKFVSSLAKAKQIASERALKKQLAWLATID